MVSICRICLVLTSALLPNCVDSFAPSARIPQIKRESQSLISLQVTVNSESIRQEILSRKTTTSDKSNTFDLGEVDITSRSQPDLQHVELTNIIDHHREDKKQAAMTENENRITSLANNSGLEKFALPIGIMAAVLASIVASNMGFTISNVIASVQSFIAHPQQSLQDVIDTVQAMGPLGPLYFGIFYFFAEILAIPATPLTMSAGYLFGLGQGTAVVLLAATLAATASFFIGKTFLRSWVESILEENPTLAKLDNAIGEEGFKLLLLVRLSPIFPFALSNYVYGASSINFVSYFWGTLFGFFPGTLAFVYTGMVGKDLTLGTEASQPWYIYAAGFGVLLTFLKLATDVATKIVNSVVEDDNNDIDQQGSNFDNLG